MNISLNQNRSIDFDVRPLLSLNYQMQYDLNGGRPFAAEALLRISGDTENAAPSEILARAEANGSIKQITLWVIDQALSDFKMLSAKQGIQRVAVNISALDISRKGFMLQVQQYLSRYRLPGGCLELEITENLPLTDLQYVIKNIELARKLGIRVVLDDFGKGCTSISALTELPIDGIKLDKTFGLNLQRPKFSEVVESLVMLCNKLDLSVLIEGIEDQNAHQLVKALGCSFGQGYYLHIPESKFALTSLIQGPNGLRAVK